MERKKNSVNEKIKDSNKNFSKYEEELLNEVELDKQVAVAETRQWIETIPEDRLDQLAIVVANKTFTPRQLMQEVENDTEYGKKFGKMLNTVRLEIAKRKEEQQ